MSAHRRQRRQPADEPRFPPLAFGGWGDYKTWAEHQFLPKPTQAPADEEAVPNDATQETSAGDAGTPTPDVNPEPEPSQPLKPRPYILLAEDAAPVAPPYIRICDEIPLRIDSLISVTPDGVRTAGSPTLSDEYRLIFELCERPTPVVEIAARLQVPVGVALVLIGRTVGWNLLRVMPPAEVDGRPPLELIIRVCEGLRRLP